MGDRQPPEMTTITVQLPVAWVELLRVLVDPHRGITGVSDVLAELADHAQQGVYRPGAWERHWLIQAFSDDFTGRLETDPDHPYFQRPRVANHG